MMKGHFSRNGFLTREGHRVAQQHSLEGLLPRVVSVIVDIPGSVSALVEVEDHWVDEVIDEQYRRFHNGS